VTRMRRSAAVAVLAAAALASWSCKGKGEERSAPAAAPTDQVGDRRAPTGSAAAPQAPAPEPIKAPGLKPVPLTLDEVKAEHPAVASARALHEPALDPSGKQVQATWCLTANDAAAGLHRVADAYGTAGWTLIARETSDARRRGAFTAELAVDGGSLIAQGAIAAGSGCAVGELAAVISYRKMVPTRSAPTP